MWVHMVPCEIHRISVYSESHKNNKTSTGCMMVYMKHIKIVWCVLK